MGVGRPLEGKLADLGSCCCCCCRAVEASLNRRCASSLPFCRAKRASSPVTAPDFTCATACIMHSLWQVMQLAGYINSCNHVPPNICIWSSRATHASVFHLALYACGVQFPKHEAFRTCKRNHADMQMDDWS